MIQRMTIEQYTRCRSGYFNLDLTNPDGCTKCFCYGHASSCQSAPNYFFNPIRSSFSQGWVTEMSFFPHDSLVTNHYGILFLGVDGWRAVNQTGHEAPIYSDMGSYIYVQSLPGQDLTFEAPGVFCCCCCCCHDSLNSY